MAAMAIVTDRVAADHYLDGTAIINPLNCIWADDGMMSDLLTRILDVLKHAPAEVLAPHAGHELPERVERLLRELEMDR